MLAAEPISFLLWRLEITAASFLEIKMCSCKLLDRCCECLLRLVQEKQRGEMATTPPSNGRKHKRLFDTFGLSQQSQTTNSESSTQDKLRDSPFKVISFYPFLFSLIYFRKEERFSLHQFNVHYKIINKLKVKFLLIQFINILPLIHFVFGLLILLNSKDYIL
jgi:hypothetical protein